MTKPEFRINDETRMTKSQSSDSRLLRIWSLVIHSSFGFLALGFCLSALILSGCNQAHSEPMSKEMMANDPDSQINFWQSLNDIPVCSNDAAFHGLLLYFYNTDENADYTGRVQTLKSHKMLPNDFNEPADMGIKRGTLAYALCQALGIKGGVTMRVLGPNGRYAVRELQFMNLYPSGSQQQTFSGTEYVGIMGRIEDFQRGDSALKPASESQGH
jgi:hypothetical protein